MNRTEAKEWLRKYITPTSGMPELFYKLRRIVLSQETSIFNNPIDGYMICLLFNRTHWVSTYLYGMVMGGMEEEEDFDMLLDWVIINIDKLKKLENNI